MLQGPEEGAGAQRAIGCPGLDDEYGTIGGAGSPYEPRWPYRCDWWRGHVTTYTPLIG